MTANPFEPVDPLKIEKAIRVDKWEQMCVKEQIQAGRIRADFKIN
jgi:hypothetical protein